MAGYVQDGGGQQGFQFGYHPEWHSGANSYAGPADNFNAHQSILNTNDNAFIDNFFNDPDTAPDSNGLMDLNWAGMDEKVNGGDFGGHFGGFDNTIHDSSTTLTGTTNSSYQTHSISNQQQLRHAPTTDFVPLQHSHVSEDDVQTGATELYNLFINGQDGSQAVRAFSGSTGGSWGDFGSHDQSGHMQETLKSPMASSGSQSANSYHGQPQTSAQGSLQFPNGQLTPQMMEQYALYQQQQMARHLSNDPRARHSSLQVGPSNFTFFPQAQPRTPHSALLPGQNSGRPPAVRFGSDNNFHTYGYRGPNTHVPLEHEKGANLNNVPFAAQAAANSHGHMHSFTPMTPSSRSYGSYLFPNGPQTYENTSTSSSPNTLGGLPTTNMAIRPNHHGHPFNQVARTAAATEDEVDSDEDAEFEETQPRKRRKSQMEAEDDDEYTPGKHHVKVPASKHGSKATKALAFDGSDDDDDYEDVPSSAKRSAKRRKSSTNARPSFGSSQSGSPANMASPTGKPATSGKKKVRGSHPRTNLTEDEKRRNHIASEKTRRDLIKVQYDQLDIMVPSLKQGKSGLSRSDILKEIVSYVEAVVDGNERLEAKLAELKNAQGVPSVAGYG